MDRESTNEPGAAGRNGQERRRRRPCLCCGESFLSEGAHHRLCGGCRGQSPDIAGPTWWMGGGEAG